MGRATQGTTPKRGRSVWRTGWAVATLVLHGVLLYVLIRETGELRTPEERVVEPIFATLVAQPRTLPTTPQLPALRLQLTKAQVLTPDVPPDFRIDLPVEPQPAAKTDPQLGNGSPSLPGVTDMSGDGATITVLRHVEPVYGAESVKDREHGAVALRVLVDEQGRPNEVRVLHSSGFPRLDQSAVQAVQGYRFTPVTQGSNATRVWTTVHLEFDLLPMPVPVTLVDLSETLAKRIEAARRTARSERYEIPAAERTLTEFARKLLEGVSRSDSGDAGARPAHRSSSPAELLARWGALRFVRFVGFAHQGFVADLDGSEVTPTQMTGSLIATPRRGGPARYEVYEVQQTGGTSYWVAIVADDGTLRRVQIAATATQSH